MKETKFNVHDTVMHIKSGQKMMIDKILCEPPIFGDAYQKPNGFYRCIWFGENATVATNQDFHEDDLELISSI